MYHGILPYLLNQNQFRQKAVQITQDEPSTQPEASRLVQPEANSRRNDNDIELRIIKGPESLATDNENQPQDSGRVNQRSLNSRSGPFLADFATRHPRILDFKSKLYFWSVLTIAIFYGLPVMQLVFTNQKVINHTQ